MTSVLVDTNLLVLLVVGMSGRDKIGRHKRTREFEEEDFDLLLSLLDPFDTYWVTAHCLAETSNLMAQTNDKERPMLLEGLASFCKHKGAKESNIAMSRIFKDHRYPRLGVADTGFLQKSRTVNCSITTDLALYLSIEKAGSRAINFNHVRQARLLDH